MIKSHYGRTVKLSTKAQEAFIQEIFYQITLLAIKPRSEVENQVLHLTKLLSNWDKDESKKKAIQVGEDLYSGQ